MPDLAAHPDPSGTPDVEPAPVPAPTTPRWVNVSAIILIALVLLFVILHLTGNSPVGMGGHAPLLQHWMLQP